jgi:protein MpaA
LLGFTAIALAAAALLGGGASTTPVGEIGRILRDNPTERPAHPVIIGRSTEDRPIRAIAWPGCNQMRVLAFGCIHGTECAARSIVRSFPRPPLPDLVAVPNLNPDGFRARVRTNARGVDLNRNFSSAWRPYGVPGDQEYSGPHPFSEAETQLARRLIRSLRPDVTIWFHQEPEPLVRAWGPSVPAARRYAHLAGLEFHALPWINGTAPNWQNHRFPGTASFVVELPLSGVGAEQLTHQALAISKLATHGT